MTDQAQRLEIATVRAEIGSNITYRFNNDAIDALLIPTDSGDIKNLKQVIADIQQEGAEKISFATKIYPTTAAGLAATANGEIFLVAGAGDDEVYAVWQNSSGAAVDTGKRAISATAVIAATDAAQASADNAQAAANEASAKVAPFLSPASTDPSVRDDGSSLHVGDTYFNTVIQADKVYSSSGWVAANVTGIELTSAINTREPSIPAGTTGQYWAGDKTFKTLDKAAVGLPNANNTSDADKPVSTAQQAALDLMATEASLANTSGSGGAALIGYMGREVGSRLRDNLSVKDYGAKCDGVTDDTAACQAAINYLKSVGGGVLRFNGGTILLTSPLTLADCSIVCVGDGIDVTVIRCLHSGNGFSFTDSSAVSVPIHRYVFLGMTIAKDGTGGRGISVSRSVLSSNPTIPSLLIRDLLCRGYSDIGTQYWDIGIYELNGGAPTIEDVSVIANGPTMTCGILLDNASNASRYNIKLDGINIQGGVTGLRVNGHAENFRLTNYEIVGSGTNIFLDGSSTAIPGGMNPVAIIGNGHANAKTYTVRAINWSVVCIENTDSYSGVGSGDTDGANILISNSKFVSIVGGKVGTGAGSNNRSGIDLQSVTDTIINTTIEGFKTGGVTMSGTCDRINISGIIRGTVGNPTSSGVYAGSTGCRVNTGVLTLENCTTGLNGAVGADNSLISGVTFKNCTTDILWNGSNYVIGDIQSSNVPPVMTLSGTGYHRKSRVNVTVDPPSIANGARTTVLVAVPGASFGDTVSVAAPYDISDMTITAFVQNVNTVGLYFQNNSGSTKDLASGTWTFALER